MEEEDIGGTIIVDDDTYSEAIGDVEGDNEGVMVVMYVCLTVDEVDGGTRVWILAE